MPIRELDIRPVPPPRRHPEIFDAFDALGPGESFVLVNDHYPKPLLYQLQAERPGTFEWSVIERGPERFRVEIRRREKDGARGVTEYFHFDHMRLDAMLPEVVRSARAGAFDEAALRFAEFACGIDWHIDAEDNVLFPALADASPLVAGPLDVMRLEHQRIRKLVSGVITAIESREAEEVDHAIQGLTEVLSLHNLKEERILYPAADRSFAGDRERDDLVKKIQAST